MPTHSFAYLDHGGFLAFAHRGGAGAWPENTMPAFQGAVDLGYAYVETDVHATRDGQLIAFHDDRLDRVTDKTGLVSELEWADVRKARVDGREPIPLLSDILSAWPALKVNIDPKADGAVEPLVKVLKDTSAVDRVCVGSFSDKRTAAVRHALGPSLCTSLGPRGTFRLRMASWLPGGVWRPSFAEGCAQVPVAQSGIPIVDRAFVEKAHACGLQVHVWTIDEPAEMERLIDIGVDGLMTDSPAVLKEVLVQRGIWR